MTQIAPNFTLEEFTKEPVTNYVKLNLVVLAKELQRIRDHFKLPVKIVVGVSNISPEHKEGKAAIITVAGKTADQIKAAMEGRVYNGTIGLLNNNQVYYSLAPNNTRWDKRTGNGNYTPAIPAPTETVEPTNEKNKKALVMGAVVLGLILVGTVLLKKK